MNIEAWLLERIGATGKKLHTARSRNDQVATDLRLYLRQEIDAIRGALDHVLVALVDLAERVYPPSDRPVGELRAPYACMVRDVVPRRSR